MINNYLDWAKRERKWYLKSALSHAREARKARDDWGKGFHKGLAMAYHYSGGSVKCLQKDIECVLKASGSYDPEDASFPLLRKFY